CRLRGPLPNPLRIHTFGPLRPPRCEVRNIEIRPEDPRPLEFSRPRRLPKTRDGPRSICGGRPSSRCPFLPHLSSDGGARLLLHRLNRPGRLLSLAEDSLRET